MSLSENLVINSTQIAPGTEELVKINVGRLPSGTRIALNLHVSRAVEPGPIVLLLGGLHGDEINGIEIVRRAIRDGILRSISRGTIIAVPIINVYGFINFSRDVPDGKDVNRSFPGSMSGSLASRVARIITKKVLPHADIIVDFHTGGANRYNYPQIRYSKGDEHSYELAKIFGAPYLIEKATIPKSLRRVSQGMGIPTIVYEGGEALRFDGLSIEIGLEGLRRVLHSQSMIDSEHVTEHAVYDHKKSRWIRAAYGGIFTWIKSSGDPVRKGEILGLLEDPNAQTLAKVISGYTGHIIGHNNSPVVNQGDALFHLAYEHTLV